MKQKDFEPCAMCGKGMMHSGAPFFYRADISQMIVNMDAVRRQHGLEMMMGDAAALAQVMGPDEDIAQNLSTVTALVCSECALAGSMPFAILLDHARDAEMEPEE